MMPMFPEALLTTRVSFLERGEEEEGEKEEEEEGKRM